ncbi:uncharacterized protein T551_03299 [Pneumocystis jirovecii RU7]|uniref:Transcriptional regulatory protein DEP1 n=1 Tax=Pneumocystis jirovecii (strain RU7) TaxID=1408657 RepID=A0A0W4ZEQ8_PNEJ7|nr:uncharacterized protein T551_03299 [Pneumocystis jirovecii RU7]KTW26837.1 hypothetical protein T551_03299 [Pneumocystis jirovecii RU7]
MARGRGRVHERETIEEKGSSLNSNREKVWHGKRLRRGRGRSYKQSQESLSNPVFSNSQVFKKNEVSVDPLRGSNGSKNNSVPCKSSYKHAEENTQTEESLNINQIQQDDLNELEAISVLEELSNSVSVVDSSYIKKSQNSNSDDLSSLSELNESEAETDRIEDIDSALDTQKTTKKSVEQKSLDINELASSQSSVLNKHKENKHDLLEAAEMLSTSSNEYTASKKDSKSDIDDDSAQSKINPCIDNESTAEEEIIESIMEEDDTNINAEDDNLDEERYQKKKDAIAALTQIEIQFAKLRDKLYENQISYLDKEVDLVNKGIHPELSSLMEKITERRKRKYDIAVAFRDMLIKSIKDEFIAHQYEIQSNFLESKRKLREKILLRTGKKCFQIYHERRLMETSLVPEYGFSIPNKRSVQLKHRRAHELEVTFLAGLKAYIGFPAAPEIKNASKDEIMQDLEEMRIKHVSSDTLHNLSSSNSTFQNVLPHNQEFHSKPYYNNVLTQSSHQKSSQSHQYANCPTVLHSFDYSSTKQHSLDKYSLFNCDQNQTSSHDQYNRIFDVNERTSTGMQLINNNKSFGHFQLSPQLNQSLYYSEPMQKDNHLYWNDSSSLKNGLLYPIKNSGNTNTVSNFRFNS